MAAGFRGSVARNLRLGYSTQQNPEHPVAVLDAGSVHAALQHRELMAEREVLGQKALAVREQPLDQGNEVSHGGEIMTRWPVGTKAGAL